MEQSILEKVQFVLEYGFPQDKERLQEFLEEMQKLIEDRMREDHVYLDAVAEKRADFFGEGVEEE